jgi:hypothetical protein
MATTIITGRDITITLASANYAAQTLSITLVNAPVITTYQALTGKQYKHIDDQWTLNMNLLADWGAASSLFEAMWTAFTNAPNTALAFTMVTATGASFAGTAFPVAPTAGGTAPDAQTDTWAMLCASTPILTIT